MVLPTWPRAGLILRVLHADRVAGHEPGLHAVREHRPVAVVDRAATGGEIDVDPMLARRELVERVCFDRLKPPHACEREGEDDCEGRDE